MARATISRRRPRRTHPRRRRRLKKDCSVFSKQVLEPTAVVRLSFCALNLSSAFYYDSHSIGLNDSDWRLRGDEFSFSNNIDNAISETRFAAWSQDGHGSPLRSWRERHTGRELSWYSGQRWTGRR